jgi:hypothetical protein
MGFLDHLAGMALGAKPSSAARPSLPSRFAASPFAGSSQGLEAIEQTPSAVPAPRAQAEAVHGPRRVATPPAPVERQGMASPAAGRSRVPPPAEPRAAEIQSVRQDGNAPQLSPPPSIADRVERRPPVEMSSPAVVEPAAWTQPPPGAHSRPVPPYLAVEVFPERPVTRAAPLSAAMVAGRATAVREQAPVVHVTIDRLDVRAPAQAEPARQRPRAQPTVSLSDYLRQGSSGGRR